MAPNSSPSASAPAPPLIGSGIALTLHLACEESSLVAKKILVAARFLGISLQVQRAAGKDLQAQCSTAKEVALQVQRPWSPSEDVWLGQSNAILRFLAEAAPESDFGGRTEMDRCQVLQWLETSFHELEVPMVMLLQSGGEALIEKEAKKYIAAMLGAVSSHLAKATFLAGERLTAADVAVACAVESALSCGVVALQDLQSSPPVFRWYMTVTHQPAFQHGGPGDSGTGNGAGHTNYTSAASVPSAEVTELPKFKFTRQRLRIRELMGQGLALEGKDVVVKGWVLTMRVAQKGALLFIALNDGSTQGSVQIVASKGETGGFEATAACGGAGACLSVRAKVVASPAKGQAIELQAMDMEVLGTVPAADYPMAKKQHGLEFLRANAHLRPRTRVYSAVARVRNAMAYATHKFFNDRGFLYVHTPLITGADCEGAGEQFVVSTMLPEGDERLNVPLTADGKVDYSQDFFGKRSCLTVSGQLNVETHCCALSDVYTFGPTFRAENSNTTRHLAEFWMIEPEVAFATLEDDMDLAEDYVKYLVSYALTHCDDELTYFEGDHCPPGAGEKDLRKRLRNVLHNEFVRLTYTKAVELLIDHVSSGKVAFEVPVSWGIDLASEHERYIAEKVYGKPVILTNYPKEIKAFYMKLDPDGRTVAAMDILVPKIGELVGGSQREENRGILLARAKEMGLEESSISWYLDLREYGTMQHAGFGLGFERLMQFITGMDNIRDVIPFPRYPGHCSF
jgi:asparaginyl-tRNA synthetase